jgi:hypothetical protein
MSDGEVVLGRAVSHGSYIRQIVVLVKTDGTIESPDSDVKLEINADMGKLGDTTVVHTWQTLSLDVDNSCLRHQDNTEVAALNAQEMFLETLKILARYRMKG